MQISEFLQRTLLWVKKPSQYIGGEWNSVRKDLSKVHTKFCLSFPDTYAIGMSYHGLKLLYELVNQCDDLACERVFTPLPDFADKLQKYQIPLFTLESKTPVKEFDLWGFSIGSEANWTNILQMLFLSQIPILAKDRSNHDPLIIAGGNGVYNPEPGALFLDLVALGDGEETLIQLLRLDHTLRQSKISRQERIQELVRQIPGLYAPQFYEVFYNPDRTIAEIRPQSGMPTTVKAAYISNLETFQATKPLVGYSDTVHNRIFLELMRGCTRGCRYCEAGMVYRPLRIQPVDTLIQEAVDLFANTGYEEICLYSLASSDYPYLGELSRKLIELFGPKGVGISLPSLRINEQMKILPELIAAVRKRTLTLAPEVGSERMRNIINKPMDPTEMLDMVQRAYQEGWDSVKLYFMVGLPFQDQEDYQGIAEMLQQISDVRRAIHGKPGYVTASIANFVPKPQTPFQWAPMATREQLINAQRTIKKLLRSPRVQVNFHDVNLSLLEGILARGNRKISEAMITAWRNGAYLDGWNEHFNSSAWTQALATHQIDLDFYLHREIPTSEILPWSHLQCAVSPQFLSREWQKAKEQQITTHCLTDHCHGCGADQAHCYRLGH